jgi:hypothetical protein
VRRFISRDEFKDVAQMVFLDANENPFENGVNIRIRGLALKPY